MNLPMMLSIFFVICMSLHHAQSYYSGYDDHEYGPEICANCIRWCPPVVWFRSDDYVGQNTLRTTCITCNSICGTPIPTWRFY